MREDDFGAIVGRRYQRQVHFDALIPRRLRNILLVSSFYDSYTFVEEGRLSEVLFSEYLDLNLRFAPRVDQVSTAHKALERLRSERYDLVISMLRVGDMNIREFAREVHRMHPGLPITLLAFNTREVHLLEDAHSLPGIDRVFVWSGDVRLFIGIIKYVEDRLNAWHDARAAGVKCIILVEDSIRFYSSYLPLLYTEIMEQVQAVMSDALNRMQKLLRQHARPKVLHATTYEEGLEYFHRYQDYTLGIIADAAFPRDGQVDPRAGIDFSRMIKEKHPDLAVLIQSSDQSNETLAKEIGAAFINKKSPSLMHELRAFMQAELGFGDFVFRRPDGSKVTSASDLRSLVEALKMIPDECLLYHGRRKDFSTWLSARTEYGLAKAIRDKKLSDFGTPAEFRKHMISSLNVHRSRTRAGIVSDFSSDTFEAWSGFVRIGSGSLGGKGRGLAFVNSLLERYRIDEHISGARIFVPPTAVLATGVFDEFLESAGLAPVVLGTASDAEIATAINQARLPEDLVEQLRTLLSRVRYPLAVRSSSLLEDASYQPFAGVYRTYMIPNNHDNLEIRLQELLSAIKLVYASTFLGQAKSYLEQTPNRLEEEKMAVVIQQLVGRRHDNYLYPDLAGVARSHNFYPIADMAAEDGVICVALGLGKTVVEGGRCFRFSPKNPNAMYKVLTSRDYLSNAQREFLSLDLSNTGPQWDDCRDTGSNVVPLGLDAAMAHGTLNKVGSVYSPRDNLVFHDVSKPGVKLVTMAGLLEDPDIRLADALSFLLEVGNASLSCPVEIEFAANIYEDRSRPLEIGFLQIRPMVTNFAAESLAMDKLKTSDAICISHRALGHGRIDDVCDIVYVKADKFNRALTRDIAEEIGQLNATFKDLQRPYLLIGPGRWGSADWRLGIPVVWGQISQARCIVETDMKDIRVSPSQGSHFFQNITSFGVGYFTVNLGDTAGMLDTAWLDAQPVEAETDHVRHVVFDAPLDIAVDSNSGTGVIMKAGHRAPRK